MIRYLAGAVVTSVGIAGLLLASANNGQNPLYWFGIAMAVGAFLAIMVLVKLHYDWQERGEGDIRISRDEAIAFTLGLMPGSLSDVMVIAFLAGVFSLAGGIVATYAVGLGYFVGMAMFFGLGGIAGLAGLKALKLMADDTSAQS